MAELDHDDNGLITADSAWLEASQRLDRLLNSAYSEQTLRTEAILAQTLIAYAVGRDEVSVQLVPIESSTFEP